MDIIVTEHLIRIVIVAPQGTVEAFNVAELRKRLYMLLDDGVINFVVDLSDVSFMDSAGLSALVSVLTRSRQAGGDVKLVWPTEEAALRILHLTKFDRVFDITDTVEEAIEGF